MAHNLASDRSGASLLHKTSSNQAHNLFSDRLHAPLLYKEVQFPPVQEDKKIRRIVNFVD